MRKPDKLQLFADRMRKMEETEGKNTPILVFSDLCVVDEALNVISDSIMYLQQQKANVADYHELLFKNVVNGNAMMINRALADIFLRCLAPEKQLCMIGGSRLPRPGLAESLTSTTQRYCTGSMGETM